jgi:hypothetical protein
MQDSSGGDARQGGGQGLGAALHFAISKMRRVHASKAIIKLTKEMGAFQWTNWRMTPRQ